jgi:CheY-like chemotaxis protein
MPDGEGVLSFLLKRPPYEDAWTPTLVVLNINLPDVNGLSLLREIKAVPALAPIPIVTWTVSQDREEIAFAYQHGAAAFVSKPAWGIRCQIAAMRAF